MVPILPPVKRKVVKIYYEGTFPYNYAACMMWSFLYICGGSRYQDGDMSPAFSDALEVDHLGVVMKLSSMNKSR